jgi:RNA polymerase sigma-70 factor (ECF subfamily)
VLSAVIDKPRGDHFDEDAVLVDRFLSGDTIAFELIYRKYYDKVFAIARGVLIDADEAADAVQEIFTLVYRHLHRFDRRAKLSTWLFRIAVNRSIQEARKHRFKNKTVELTEAADRAAPVESQEIDPRIHSALANLAPQDRALLTLFYWEELSLNEIADSIGCNVNAAKTRLYRARERFRTIYEGEE